MISENILAEVGFSIKQLEGPAEHILLCFRGTLFFLANLLCVYTTGKVTCTMPTSIAVQDAQLSVNALAPKMTSSQSYSPISGLPVMLLKMLITVIVSDPLVTNSRLEVLNIIFRIRVNLLKSKAKKNWLNC